MRFAFTPQQLAFRDEVRALLEKECTPAHVRAAWTEGASPERWQRLASMGVVGLLAPEEHGGLGSDETTLVSLLEESGRACLPEPLLECAAVAIPLLRDHAPEQLRARWLAAAASGEAIVTVGFEQRTLVAAADGAGLMLLEHHGEIHAVEPARARLERQSSWDGARRLFAVGFEPSPTTLVTADPAAAAEAFDRGALGAAAQLLGIGARAIEMAAAYAKERHQFGVPIGTFQAVKHLLADALLRIEFARPLVYRAAWSVAQREPARARDVSMAKASASDAAVFACRAALQVHGAIGYTKEHDLHLWLARGSALATAWGDASRHRARVDRILLG
ncbi:MAG TPA: acyl-CoA dehydrogenase family protein [Actinomycetota bacterium]